MKVLKWVKPHSKPLPPLHLVISLRSSTRGLCNISSLENISMSSDAVFIKGKTFWKPQKLLKKNHKSFFCIAGAWYNEYVYEFACELYGLRGGRTSQAHRSPYNHLWDPLSYMPPLEHIDGSVFLRSLNHPRCAYHICQPRAIRDDDASTNERIIILRTISVVVHFKIDPPQVATGEHVEIALIKPRDSGGDIKHHLLPLSARPSLLRLCNFNLLKWWQNSNAFCR